MAVVPGPDSESHDDSGVHQQHGGVFLHGGHREVVLFAFWTVETPGELFLSCLVCFLLAVLYEGLKLLREEISRGGGGGREGAKERTEVARSTSCGYDSTSDAKVSDAADSAASNTAAAAAAAAAVRRPSPPLAASAALHVVTAGLSYSLMLVVMTLNAWLCASVLAGSAAGHVAAEGWTRRKKRGKSSAALGASYHS